MVNYFNGFGTLSYFVKNKTVTMDMSYFENFAPYVRCTEKKIYSRVSQHGHRTWEIHQSTYYNLSTGWFMITLTVIGSESAKRLSKAQRIILTFQSLYKESVIIQYEYDSTSTYRLHSFFPPGDRTLTKITRCACKN